jgi:hypothetical protein
VPMGTPGYMAAEQCLNAFHATTMSDVFSLGATLYDLLAGLPPFPKDLAGTLLKTPTGAYIPLAERRPDVSRGTAAIVAKCLAREPRDRFPHAGELLVTLEARLLDLDRPTSMAPEPGAIAPPFSRSAGAPSEPPPGTPPAAPVVSAAAPRASVAAPRRSARSGSVKALAGAALVTGAAVVAWQLASRSGDAPATLRVDSSPQGAQVFVDGNPVGNTPLAGVEIPSRRRLRVVVRSADGVMLDKVVRAEPGRVHDLGTATR